MSRGRRWILGLLFLLALTRALSYLVCAAVFLPSPLESYHLEAKMVLLAYRAERGLSLYPDWEGYPHVTNFYGPVYFGVVGLIGRALAADIPELFRIGRWLSFGSGLLTTGFVGLITARRYGRGPGVAGATLSMATGSMLGFSVMTRPDMTAELLGMVGFWLAISPSATRAWSGGLILVLAILTKQTAALFLGAAVLAWWCDGHWRRGAAVGLGVAAVVGAVVGMVTLGMAPSFAGSLLGDAQTPWSLWSWRLTISRLVASSPDVVVFPTLGLILWGLRWTGRRETALLVLATLILVTSFVTSAKRGSDLNYCLSLRVVECLAVGALWRSWALATTRLRAGGLLVAALIGCLTVVPGVVATFKAAQGALGTGRFFASSYGRAYLSYQQKLQSLAADPDSRILTDSGMLELYQGDRAAFGDPFLFRIMVDTGRIDPALMRERIDSGYYDLVVTTSAIDLPTYATYEFGLPMVLVDRIRARYAAAASQGSLFLYERRAAAAGHEPPP